MPLEIGKLAGGKERENNRMGKGACNIKSFCATGDKGTWGKMPV